ncbi:hypothetical protein FAES_0598 [Fibrella aestuarina BUZ 2]|uniref:Uncharacterized protein n=1 Tax=Fibrella aestuarina BUZ 2 TaxID=1166018 RepID=I0K3A6_9BACT|nr:hypothetical protein [Fibrella aestuarina]CCG98609.1 hypothetical protein FAES_0598 [Fibrella aestuarina BUZ 2]
MTSKQTLGWLHASLFGLLLWFFGNLYEEVILMPNWLVAPLDVLHAYNRFYSVVLQYHYYVPITQLAVLTLVWLCFRQNPARLVAPAALKRAAIWGGVGTLLTVLIVLQLNVKLFLGPVAVPEAEAHRLGVLWMLGNAIRLFCVGKTIGYALRVRDALRDSQRGTVRLAT